MSNLYVGIVGSRGYNTLQEMDTIIHSVLDDDFDDSSVCIVSGGARGADALAKRLALQHKYHYVEVPALWDIHGKAAGPLRNPVIIDLSDVVFAFWDGQSRGTLNSINIAKAANKPLVIYNYTTKEVKAFT